MVAVYGTTGIQNKIQQYTIDALRNTRKIAKNKIPVGIGFGISTPDDARRFIRQGADAVIIGSALIKLVENTPHARLEKTVTDFTRKLKNTTKR